MFVSVATTFFCKTTSSTDCVRIYIILKLLSHLLSFLEDVRWITFPNKKLIIHTVWLGSLQIKNTHYKEKQNIEIILKIWRKNMA
jgi:hypothetical protein